MDILNFTDTEPETSFEPDENEKKHTQATNYSRKSLFNITFDNLEEQKHESVELKDYETHLNDEMKHWKSLLYKAYQDLKKSKEKHPIVDKTILTPENLKYLENAPNLQNFIRDSIEFRQKAQTFLEIDYPEYMEVLQNLEELCEDRLVLLKANKIREHLANIKKKK